MKKSFLRAGAAALACAMGLAACGGSSGTLYLGGTPYGVTEDGLVLQNNGGHDLAVTLAHISANSGMFIFPDYLSVDEAYNVTVKGGPTGSIPSNAEKCEVSNGQGRSAYSVTNITVVCTLKTHALTVQINNLGNATGLVVVNGADRKAVTAETTTTTTTPSGTITTLQMDKVGEALPYGISILSQPTGLTCTVANGSGTMAKADVTATITCAPTSA